MRKFMAMAFLSASLLVAACGDNAADKVDAALAEKFNISLCLEGLQHFPHASTHRPRDWLQPLVDDGLLVMEERVSPRSGAKEYLYTMTKKAQKYTVNNRFFCYGKQEFVRAEGLNEPKGGFKPGHKANVKVFVKWKVEADWAKAEALKGQVQSGEFTYPAVVIFKDDGTVHVLK